MFEELPQIPLHQETDPIQKDQTEVYYFGTEQHKPNVINEIVPDEAVVLKRVDFQSSMNYHGSPGSSTKNIYQKKSMRANIKAVYSGQKFTIMLDDKQHLWGFGNSLEGQLGIQSANSCQKQPLNINKYISTHTQKIKFSSVSCGENYSFALSKIQQKQIIQIEAIQKNVLSIQIIVLLNYFRLKHTHDCFKQQTNYFYLCLIATGQLYGWGNNIQFRLGIEDEIKHFTPPTDLTKEIIIENLDKISDELQSNVNSMPVLIQSSSQTSNPGQPTQRRKIIEKKSQIQANIQFVVAGRSHSYVLSNDQYIVFGYDHKGKMGLGTIEDSLVMPTIIPLFEKSVKIMGISIGKNHSAAWDINGAIYTWGDAIDGKLGHPIEYGSKFSSVEPSPKRVLQLKNEYIIQASCGNNITVALTYRGEIYQWGKGEYSSSCPSNQIPNIMEAIIPKKLIIKDEFNQNTKFVKIVCGFTHQAALDQFGRLYTWGDMTEDCLGHSLKKDLQEPQMVKALTKYRVLDVSCGQHFTVALTVSRESRLDSEFSKRFKDITITDAKRNIQILQQYQKQKIKLLDISSSSLSNSGALDLMKQLSSQGPDSIIQTPIIQKSESKKDYIEANQLASQTSITQLKSRKSSFVNQNVKGLGEFASRVQQSEQNRRKSSLRYLLQNAPSQTQDILQQTTYSPSNKQQTRISTDGQMNKTSIPSFQYFQGSQSQGKQMTVGTEVSEFNSDNNKDNFQRDLNTRRLSNQKSRKTFFQNQLNQKQENVNQQRDQGKVIFQRGQQNIPKSIRRTKIISAQSDLSQPNMGISFSQTQYPKSNLQSQFEQVQQQNDSQLSDLIFNRNMNKNVSMEFGNIYYNSNDDPNQSKNIQQSILESPFKPIFQSIPKRDLQTDETIRTRQSNKEKTQISKHQQHLDSLNQQILSKVDLKTFSNIDNEKEQLIEQKFQNENIYEILKKHNKNDILVLKVIDSLLFNFNQICDITDVFMKERELNALNKQGSHSTKEFASLEFDKVSTSIFTLQESNPTYLPIQQENYQEIDEFWRNFDTENLVTTTKDEFTKNINMKTDNILFPKLKSSPKKLSKKRQSQTSDFQGENLNGDAIQKRRNQQIHNEVLKYEYIEIIKQNRENEHLLYLLEDPQQRGNLTKKRIKEIQQQFVEEKKESKSQVKFKQQFSRDLVPLTYVSMKEDLKKISDTKQRNRKLLAQSDHYDKNQFLNTWRKPSPTRDQILLQIKFRGQELTEKMNKANIQRDKLFEEKINRLKVDQKKKERMLATIQALEKKKKQAYNQKLFKIMSYLNIERWLQYIQQTAYEGLQLRRNMFKIHMKVRVIQSAFRKYLIHKHVMQRMNPRVEKFFKDVIFKFKMRRNIKKKRKACKVILFNLITQKLKYKVKYQLMVIRRSIRKQSILNNSIYFYQHQFIQIQKLSKLYFLQQSIQKFAVWTQKQLTWQMSQISQQWDLYMSNMFKIIDSDVLALARRGAQQDSSRTQRQQSQFGSITNALENTQNTQTISSTNKQKIEFDINNFIGFKEFKNYMNLKSRMLKMNERLGANKYEKEEFKIIPNYLPTTYDVRNSISHSNMVKMVTNTPKVQNPLSPERNSISANTDLINTPRNKTQETYDIFLPFTVHNNKVQLLQSFRIKYESEHIHQKIYLRVIEEEIKIKYNLIKELIQSQRKAYCDAIKSYYEQLQTFIEKNKQEVNLERTQLMLKTSAQKLKHYQFIEDYNYAIQENRRKKGIKLSKYIIINLWSFQNQFQKFQIGHVFQKDHLPFSSMMMEIASKMPKAPQRPKLKIKFTMKMFEDVYVKSYYDKFVAAYAKLASDQRQKSLLQMTKYKKQEKETKREDEMIDYKQLEQQQQEQDQEQQ